MAARGTPSPLRPGRGVLFLIAVFFVTSGLVRMGDGVAFAVAKEIPDFSVRDSGPCTPAPDLAAALEAVRKRDAELDAQAAALEKRSRALDLAEVELSRQIALLNEAQADLRRVVSVAEKAAEDDVSRLTAVYEKMKPKDAARLFEAMAPDFAAGFLARMRPEAAAEVLAGLTPEVAYSISVVVAGRNAAAPAR
ncbi:flagellar motility protein MotE (MotC chaperone) [Rhodovulum imhoffii]|uniref:Flagellar motility protein MotE (MotC chaperone) n=1 Tax=Rhodovulum imhoffii TaxID=365340 RepID=A0A2T5BRQ2_9RHOB|nr:hypothetical protein [Rhodovulum imhoffii]MBK5934071.1 hypothetical protein [Rhodovulum imhoffii]PTN01956.1 flagellar motility protein MotE (MotC chaperone) [Rhodovulum imhoffii]